MVKITIEKGVIIMEHPRAKPLSDDELERLCEHIIVRKEPRRTGGGVSGSADKTVFARNYVCHYYCKLTNQPCVGNAEIMYPPRGTLSPDIVSRCPSHSDYK